MRDRQERNRALPQNSSLSDHFSRCFEHAEIGLAVTDPEGHVLETNSAYILITGY